MNTTYSQAPVACLALAALMAMAGASTGAQAKPLTKERFYAYKIQSSSNPTLNCYTSGINDSGQVVAAFVNDDFDVVEPYVTGPRGVGRAIIPNVPAYASSVVPTKINNAGDLIGSYINVGNGQRRAFYSQASTGAFKSLNPPQAVDVYARGLNDEGRVVGHFTAIQSSGMGDRPFVTQPQGVGTLQQSSNGRAAAINNSGHYVIDGYNTAIEFSSGVFHPSQGGVLFPIALPSNLLRWTTEGLDAEQRIFASAMVLPISLHQAFLSDPNRQNLRQLTAPGLSGAWLSDVTASGEFVGTNVGPKAEYDKGILLNRAGEPKNLQKRVISPPVGVKFREVTGVNAHNQLSVDGQARNGLWSCYILCPTPNCVPAEVR